MFTVVYNPGDGTKNDPSKPGFKTREEAIQYIMLGLCKSCKKDLKDPNIHEVFETMCGAEWDIILDSEMEEFHGKNWYENRPEPKPTDQLIPILSEMKRRFYAKKRREKIRKFFKRFFASVTQCLV